MKRALFLFFCIFSFFSVHGQVNYVRNPSLEDYWRCPSGFQKIKFAKYWSGISDTLFSATDSMGNLFCTPQYDNACSADQDASVPININFVHYPHTGNGVAEARMFVEGEVPPAPWDYLQGRFYMPLSANKSYCVSFYVALSQGAGFAINHIGAYLDNGTIDTVNMTCGMPQTQFSPQIVETAIINNVTSWNDSTSWTKIEGSFIANGTEQFITIGDFFDTVNTAHVLTTTTPGDNIAWYLIDDVSVIESDHIAFAGNDTTISQGDSILLGEIAVPYVWYKDSSGSLSLIDSTSGFIMAKPDTTTTYAVKQTLCGIVTWDTVVVTVMPVNAVSVANMKNVFVYPNPVQNELVIENAENCTVQIYDLVGKELYSGIINQNKETVNTSYLSSGTYFLEITCSNGERVIKKIVK